LFKADTGGPVRRGGIGIVRKGRTTQKEERRK